MPIDDLTTVLPAGAANTPHLAWPPRFAADGSVGVVEQDSPAHVAQRASVICNVNIGDLVDAPKFGTPELPFLQGAAVVAAIRTALRTWEPTLNTALTDDDLTALAQQVNVAIPGAPSV